MHDVERSVDPDLVARIYEAGADEKTWPRLLEDIALSCSAKGALFISHSAAGPRWLVSERMAEDVDRYMAEGWAMRDERVPPLIHEHFPGFRSETDYWSEDQLRRMAVRTDFLLPLGLVAGVGTLIQGVRHDSLHMAIEGYASHAAARSALPYLDLLRPHIARSLGLWAKLNLAHEQGVVEGLGAAGVPAAVIAPDRKLRAANALFRHRVAEDCIDRTGRLWFAAPATQAQLISVVDGPRDAGARSIAFWTDDEQAPCGLHILPLHGRARDIFESDGWLILLAEGHNTAVPHADLLRILFDLTPAEAGLARRLAEGMTLEQAATAFNIRIATARVHLRSIFAKVGVQRQADLRAMLISLALREPAQDEGIRDGQTCPVSQRRSAFAASGDGG